MWCILRDQFTYNIHGDLIVQIKNIVGEVQERQNQTRMLGIDIGVKV